MIQAFFNNALIVDDDFLITKIISKLKVVYVIAGNDVFYVLI